MTSQMGRALFHSCFYRLNIGLRDVSNFVESLRFDPASKADHRTVEQYLLNRTLPGFSEPAVKFFGDCLINHGTLCTVKLFRLLPPRLENSDAILNIHRQPRCAVIAKPTSVNSTSNL